MEHCYTCQRQLATIRSVIEIDGVRYCSDACRQRHRGKTAQEQRQDRRAQKRSAIGKSFPFLLFGEHF